MIGRKLLFDNESLPDTYNESPLPQSPDANELFAQWDSPMQSPTADVQDSGHYDQNIRYTKYFTQKYYSKILLNNITNFLFLLQK
jgi:hypothetical protein